MSRTPDTSAADPRPDCARCARLADYRRENGLRYPGWHNGPVPSHGQTDSEVLIVGLAPGLKGANRTGQAFAGDASGKALHEALAAAGLAHRSRTTASRSGGDLVENEVQGCLITNAVRCAPPQNRPTAHEIAQCRPHLAATMAAMPGLRAVLALGRVAHDSTLRALDCRVAAHPFAHGASHAVRPGLTLYDSYHCSRYNMSTGRLTPAMLLAVLEAIRVSLGLPAPVVPHLTATSPPGGRTQPPLPAR
jgi:uracil-DNA glycosylase